MPQTDGGVPGGHAVARRHPALRRVLLEGGDPRRGVGATGGARFRCPSPCWSLAAFLTAFYMFRVVFIAFFGAPARRTGGHGTAPEAGHGHGGHPHDAPAGDERCPSGSSPSSRWPSASSSPSTTREPEFAAPGWLTPLAVAVAVARHRAGVAHVPAPRHRARRALAARLRAHPPRRPRALLARRPLRRALPRRHARPVSRVVGWIDRYLVDGVAQRALARGPWTRGDRLRRIQSGQPQDYVYGVAFGLLLLAPRLGASGRDERRFRCRLLSIITWTPFVGAVLIMFVARHHPLLVRVLAVASTGISLVLSLAHLRGVRPRGGGLPVLRGARAGAAARHQLPAGRGRDEPAHGAADLHHHLRGRRSRRGR